MTHPVRHDSVLHHRQLWSPTEADTARRRALAGVFVGLPAAALLWQLWSRVVIGPGPRVASDRFDGWAAVAVMLPATLVVVGVAVGCVALAAKAWAVSGRAARTASGIAFVGLFLVLSVLATTSADDVQGGASAELEWALRLVALGVAGLVVAVSRWWAREAGG